MKVTVETYNDPAVRECAGWAGVITLPEGGPHGDGWCIFVPADGGAPVVSERDEGKAGE